MQGVDETEAEQTFEPQGPRPIKKLSNDVINQIAAAEVGLTIQLSGYL